MKIVIKNTIGTKKEFKDKEDFMRFAIRELENSIYSNNEEDDLKWDILNGKEVSISDVMSLLHDYQMLQSDGTWY